MPETHDLSLDVVQTVEIDAAVGDAYNALLRRLTDENSTPDNKAMPMVLEQWPGGRWFRDLGHGQGHLWGFVQVIKPPNLIEIHGPLFMSYPVVGHIQFRLTQIPGGTELYLHHRALGPVEEMHREGVTFGWEHFVNGVKQLAE
jgi:hypothetical protein